MSCPYCKERATLKEFLEKHGKKICLERLKEEREREIALESIDFDNLI